MKNNDINVKNSNFWDTFWFVICLIILIVGIASICYSVIMQMVLCYRKFGVIISGETSLVIPDKSLWGFVGILGIIPMQIYSKN